MIKRFILIILLLASVLGCTKDDICEEISPTTSLLVIEFKDFFNQNEAKAVNNLKVLINTIDSTEVFSSTEMDTLMSIPLNTEALFSEFQFVSNSTDTININTDIIRFNYTREDIYINRACAFRVTYNDLDITPITNNDTDSWVLGSEILKPTIEDETEAHLTIFH